MNERFDEIRDKIFMADNIDCILIDLDEDIRNLFESEALRMYYVDGKTWELVRRFRSGGETLKERLPLSPSTLPGKSAYWQRLLNVKNAHDWTELAANFPALNPKAIDAAFHRILVAPIVFKNMLLGVVQLVNRRDGNPFDAADEAMIRELAKTIGIGLVIQKRIVQGTRPVDQKPPGGRRLNLVKK